ncbi:MAG: sensor histidine kinase [Myxococcaceae bacterium]|nr:sensor histidine kinase [Myxococcaceae bacterium]
MSFRTKILLALIAVGVAPALAMSVLSWNANREELVSTVGGAQREVAEEAARFADGYVQQAIDDLRRAVDYIPFAQLSRDELGKVLAIPFRQMPALESVAVLDERADAVVPPMVRTARLQAHLGTFAERIPFRAALEDGLAVGAPWKDDADGLPRLAVAVRIDASEPAATAEFAATESAASERAAAEGAAAESAAAESAAAEGPRVIAGEVSLAALVHRLEELSRPDRVAALIAPDGALVASASSKQAAGVMDDPAWTGLAHDVTRDGTAKVQALGTRDGREWLAAAAPLPELGWTLVLARPAHAAFSAAERVARYVIYWAAIALVLTLVLGLFVSRGISRPVGALSAAAEALRAGDYGRRVEVASKDELGSLAATFNAMAEEIARRDREIRAFNDELQRRVEEKSAELQQARDQIERSRRLEGLVSLGAGLAHEMNNPLTSVLGILSLVKDDIPRGTPNADLLEVAAQDAARIARIVERFRRFVEQETFAPERFDLGQVVKDAIALARPELDAAKVRARATLPEGAHPVSGDPKQLAEAIRQLLLNSAQAMPEGGELSVQLSEPEKGALKLTVSDTGEGIPEALRERVFDPFFTTKRDSARLGLGLTLVHRVVQAHHGRILLESAPGKGTTVTVLLPGAAGAAHLR